MALSYVKSQRMHSNAVNSSRVINTATATSPKNSQIDHMHEMTKEYIKMNKKIGIFSPSMLQSIQART